MKGYLGETKVNIKKDPNFSTYTKNDWAMYFITLYGQIDGDHHKTWVLDQVARILNGTEVVVKLAKWSNGHKEYRITTSKKLSMEYLEWVKEMKGEITEDGRYEYNYNEGIAP